MKKAFILGCATTALMITSAWQHGHAQEQQPPAAAKTPAAADVLNMLEEDLAALPDNPAGEDAEHLRRLQRLYELKSEVIVEPAGAAPARPTGPTVAELDIYELDEEVEMLWKEIADLRRTINEMNGQSFRDDREQPGITEPIPYDSEPDPSQGEPDSAP